MAGKAIEFRGRVRRIRPEIFTDERFVNLEAGDRLLFMGLLVFSNLTGEIPDDSDRIRATVFPYRPTYDIESGLNAMVCEKLICRGARDGLPFIQIKSLNDFIEAKSPVTNHANEARRRARKVRAMPAWANRAAIRAIYVEAKKRIKDTGESWHVDHVIPLAGKNVCGLHVHHNLQIILGIDNMRKSNKFNGDEL